MQIDDFTSNGMVRRWSLIDGQPRCVDDAIDANAAGALAALQQNAAIRAMIGPVEAYEAAQAIVARGEPDNGQPKEIPDPAWVDPGDGSTAPLIANPDWALLPRTVETVGADGQPVTGLEPRWTAYDDAQAAIVAATADTKAFALWRAGEPSATDQAAHDAWSSAKAATLARLDTLAAQELADDPRPVNDAISDRQFWQAAAMLGWITTDEALAAVTVGAIPKILSDAIATLPAPQQFAVKMAVAGSNTFHLSNPATPLLMQLLGKQRSDAVPIWRLGSSLS